MAFPAGWGFYAPITIDNTKVSGAGNLTDFPVALTRATLPDEMFDPSGSPCQADGGDIRFSLDSAGTTQLALEVVSVSLDSSTGAGDGQAELHIKVPTLFASVDTTIYVWWSTATSESQPAVTDTYGRNSVWTNFFAVFHFNNGGREDASGNQPDLILHQSGYVFTEDGTSGTVLSGAPLGADAFWYEEEYLSCLSTGWTGNRNDVACSIVHRFNTSAIAQRRFNNPMQLHGASAFNNFNQNVYISTGSGAANAPYAFTSNSGSSFAGDGSPSVVSSTNWRHVGGTAIDGTSIELAVDGVADGASVTSLPNPNGLFERISLGVDNGYAPGRGVYDEARVWKEGVPVEVLQTEANNLKNFPSTFASAGAAVPVGGGGTDVDVDVTGVAATGAVGTVTVQSEQNVTTPVTGVSATGAAGSVTVTADASTTVTGVPATGAAGSVTVNADASTTVTGVAATGAAGSVTVTADASTTVTGVAATGAVGTVTVQAVRNATVSITGVAATGTSGSVVVETGGNVTTNVTGVPATGSVGDVTVTAQRFVSVDVTGVAATGASGAVTVATQNDVTANVTGVSATGSVGDVTVTTQGTVSVDVTGVSATGSVGAVVVPKNVSVDVTGASATGSVGAVTVSTETSASVSVSGLSATASVGSTTQTGAANVSIISNVQATGQVGTAEGRVPQSVSVPVIGVSTEGRVGTVTVAFRREAFVTGVAATGQVGSVSASSLIVVNLEGLVASAESGGILVYSRIVPNQTPNWVHPIRPLQTPNWVPVFT